MIKASKAHAATTRMTSIDKANIDGKVLDLASIFKKISEEGPFVGLPPSKYGRAMESEALSVFLKTFKDAHKKAKASECEIFTCYDRPFLGDSPDHIFECGAVENFVLR